MPIDTHQSQSTC